MQQQQVLRAPCALPPAHQESARSNLWELCTQAVVCICCPQGKLTVLLDLDGTLITSFPPKRAPNVPSTPIQRTHLVGVGSKLNPLGVFVVERPELVGGGVQLWAGWWVEAQVGSRCWA